jgi:hypothetical protein
VMSDIKGFQVRYICPKTRHAYRLARVSTIDQTLALQRGALKAARCERIYTDKGVGGCIADRPGLGRAAVPYHRCGQDGAE